MPINSAGLDLIKGHESLRLSAYDDATGKPVPAGGKAKGVLTIGWGHTSAAGAPVVTPGLRITKADAERILQRDIGDAERAVQRAVKIPLNPNQFAALVSFCFNVGETKFRGSSVLRAVNASDFAAVPGKLALWNKQGNKVLNGLVRRRKEEGDLFTRPVPTPATIPAAVPIPVAKPDVLMVGSKGPRVEALQQELSRLNYHPGGFDGIYGNLTRDAVLAFQADNHLKTDGMAGEQTWAALKVAKRRPLMAERKTDTLTDLAGKGSEIADGAVKSQRGAWAAISAGVATVGAKIGEHASDLVNLPLDVFRQGFETWGPWLFGTAILAAGVFFLWQARRVGAARVADHQDAKTL